MSQQPLLQLTLGLEGLNEDELLELAANLRQELAESDVESVATLYAGDAPAFSKGLDPATAQLLITLGEGLLPAILLLIQNFLLRQKDQTLKIKIKEVELEVPRNAKPEEVEKIIKMVKKLTPKGG
jgi:hypothetical protein